MSRPTLPPFNTTMLYHTALILAVFSLLCSCGKSKQNAAATEQAEPDAALAFHLPPHQLRDAIVNSGKFLDTICNEHGRFVYRLNLSSMVKVSERYNIVRHAGTIYCLTMLEQYAPSPKNKDLILRACDFLKKNAVGEVEGHPGMLAVWTRPEVTNTKTKPMVKLGSSGLGLTALCATEKIAPGTTSKEYLAQMAEFIVYMQNPNGSFASKYVPSEGGKAEEWVSLYYPGESALGLVMLYEIDGNKRWLDAATQALLFLAKNREGQSIVEPDHWAILATARLLPHVSDPTSRKQLMDHAKQISLSMLDTDCDQNPTSPMFGCFLEDGRTTPTATRLEGLLAALTFLNRPEDKEVHERILRRAPSGIRFLVGSQLKQAPYTGGMTRAAALLPVGHPQLKRGFNQRATEIRIDYVQHALSAMIQFTAFNKYRKQVPTKDK